MYTGYHTQHNIKVDGHYRGSGRQAAKGQTCKDLVSLFKILVKAAHGRSIPVMLRTYQKHCRADSATCRERGGREREGRENGREGERRRGREREIERRERERESD